MLIENSFDVDADPDRVFEFLQNPHNVATCFPGAELTEDLGDDQYRGKVKIKLGPVTAAFSGVAKITERDEAARTAVLVAEGKDARGSGTAKATATMRVEPKDGGSNVLLTTDLTISGKLAQFGRGIMADVSSRMVNDLAVRVRERIEGESAEAEAAAKAGPALAEAAPTSAPAGEPETATGAPAAASDGTPETAAEAPAGTTTASEGTAGTAAETATPPEVKAETAAEAAGATTAPEGTAGTAAKTPAETATPPGDKAETAAEPATSDGEPEKAPGTPAAEGGKSKTVAEAPAEAPAETTSGSTAEEAADTESGVVSGATTETATAAAAAKPAPAAEPTAKATPAASSEPVGAIKATTLLKVMIAGIFRRLFARLRGRSDRT